MNTSVYVQYGETSMAVIWKSYNAADTLLLR